MMIQTSTQVKRGRKKLPRKTTFDSKQLLCTQWGPVGISDEQRKAGPVILMSMCELQALIDKDMDGMTMEQACKDMEVSKTVFAGIYTSARQKVIESIVSGATLQIECS